MARHTIWALFSQGWASSTEGSRNRGRPEEFQVVRADGYGPLYEINKFPERRLTNQIYYETATALAQVASGQGILEWDHEQRYKHPALVWRQGEMYTSLADNRGIDPLSLGGGEYWRQLGINLIEFATGDQVRSGTDHELVITPRTLAHLFTTPHALLYDVWKGSTAHYGLARIATGIEVDLKLADLVVTPEHLHRTIEEVRPFATELELNQAVRLDVIISPGMLKDTLFIARPDNNWQAGESQYGLVRMATDVEARNVSVRHPINPIQVFEMIRSKLNQDYAYATATEIETGISTNQVIAPAYLQTTFSKPDINVRWQATSNKFGLVRFANQTELDNGTRRDRVVSLPQFKGLSNKLTTLIDTLFATAAEIESALDNDKSIAPEQLKEALFKSTIADQWAATNEKFGLARLATISEYYDRDLPSLKNRTVSIELLGEVLYVWFQGILRRLPFAEIEDIRDTTNYGFDDKKVLDPRMLQDALFSTIENREYNATEREWGLTKSASAPEIKAGTIESRQIAPSGLKAFFEANDPPDWIKGTYSQHGLVELGNLADIEAGDDNVAAGAGAVKAFVESKKGDVTDIDRGNDDVFPTAKAVKERIEGEIVAFLALMRDLGDARILGRRETIAAFPDTPWIDLISSTSDHNTLRVIIGTRSKGFHTINIDRRDSVLRQQIFYVKNLILYHRREWGQSASTVGRLKDKDGTNIVPHTHKSLSNTHDDLFYITPGLIYRINPYTSTVSDAVDSYLTRLNEVGNHLVDLTSSQKGTTANRRKPFFYKDRLVYYDTGSDAKLYAPNSDDYIFRSDRRDYTVLSVEPASRGLRLGDEWVVVLVQRTVTINSADVQRRTFYLKKLSDDRAAQEQPEKFEIRDTDPRLGSLERGANSTLFPATGNDRPEKLIEHRYELYYITGGGTVVRLDDANWRDTNDGTVARIRNNRVGSQNAHDYLDTTDLDMTASAPIGQSFTLPGFTDDDSNLILFGFEINERNRSQYRIISPIDLEVLQVAGI